jgi:hypothetical protein
VHRAVLGVLATAFAVLIASCASESPTPAPPTPAPTTVSPGTRSSMPAGTVLDCTGPIGTYPTRPAGARSVLDVVAFYNDHPVQQGSDSTAPYGHFAKTALVVRVGGSARVAVAPLWRDRASITWGNHAAEWTTDLTVPPCPGPTGGWLVFPGGLSVTESACMALTVTAGTRRATVWIGVGRPC